MVVASNLVAPMQGTQDAQSNRLWNEGEPAKKGLRTTGHESGKRLLGGWFNGLRAVGGKHD